MTPQARCRARLALEPLEDRTAPAIFSVASQSALAAAISAAHANGQVDTIRVVRDINLSAAPLPAFTADGGRAVTIEGNAHVLRRTGTVPFRILENDGAHLTITHLTLTGGVAIKQGGGGIFNHAGRLTLDHVWVAGNRAVGNTVGGGIFNFTGATLAIRDSFIAANHSATFGGGMRNIGRVISISGSTFANNSAATDGGGGICNFFGGVIDVITNSTFTGNSAVRGGAICNHGSVSLINCTLVGNHAQLTGGGLENDQRVHLLINCIIAQNKNGDLFPNAPVFAWNNLIGGNPRLGPLQNNGGPTPTMTPLLGSPALGLGTTYNAPHVDQRGFPRPAGGPIDIGAVQSTRSPLV